MRDREAEKQNARYIAIIVKMRARERNKIGDDVLIKQDMQNKFQSQFKPKLCKVLNKTGNSVRVESDEGGEIEAKCYAR